MRNSEEQFAPIFPDRLGRLNQLAWQLSSLRDQDVIFHVVLAQAAALVGAESSFIWLWDNDTGLPNYVLGADDASLRPLCTDSPSDALADLLPASLRRLLCQASVCACPFGVDGGEAEADWPAPMRGRPIAFIPLPAPQGCQGILTVHHRAADRFTHDDIFLLSSLGIMVAIACQNVQSHDSEHRLIGLLQHSVQQVVQAASAPGQYDELVHSLLRVAEGMVKADAIYAEVTVEGYAEPIVVTSITEPSWSHDELSRGVAVLRALAANRELPHAGQFGDLLGKSSPRDELAASSYLADAIVLGGKACGFLYAVRQRLFSDDHRDFLHTIAVQIGVGVENMQSAEKIQRLSIQLADLNDVSQRIAGTFEASRILTIVSQALARALTVPVVLCGWGGDDGIIRVLPETTVGLAAHTLDEMPLLAQYPVVQQVLTTHTVTTSQTHGAAATAFPMLAQLGMRGWLCAPMVIRPRTEHDGPRTAGIMLIADRQERTFTAHEQALVSTYANQAALAMDNALLYATEHQRLRRTRLLYQLVGALNATHDTRAILRALLDAALDAVQAGAGFITITEDGTEMQRVAHSAGIGHTGFADWTWQPGSGIIGLVAASLQPQTFARLQATGLDARLHHLARREQFHTSASVPLLVKQQAVGTLTIFTRATRALSAEEVTVLELMANEAATALENTRLYRAEQMRTREVRTFVGEVTRQRATALALARELVAIADALTPHDPARLLRWLDGLHAVSTAVDEEMPTLANVKEAMRRLHAPAIPVLGTGILLPLHEAMVLAVYLQEALAITRDQAAGDEDAGIRMTFQQFGQSEALVQLEDRAAWGADPASVDQALIALLQRTLPGTLTDSWENGQHQQRFRFRYLPRDME